MNKVEGEGMKNENEKKKDALKCGEAIGKSIGDKEEEKAPETANQSLRPHKHDICHNASRLLLTVSGS